MWTVRARVVGAGLIWGCRRYSVVIKRVRINIVTCGVYSDDISIAVDNNERLAPWDKNDIREASGIKSVDRIV